MIQFKIKNDLRVRAYWGRFKTMRKESWLLALDFHHNPIHLFFPSWIPFLPSTHSDQRCPLWIVARIRMNKNLNFVFFKTKSNTNFQGDKKKIKINFFWSYNLHLFLRNEMILYSTYFSPINNMNLLPEMLNLASQADDNSM